MGSTFICLLLVHLLLLVRWSILARFLVARVCLKYFMQSVCFAFLIRNFWFWDIILLLFLLILILTAALLMLAELISVFNHSWSNFVLSLQLLHFYQFTTVFVVFSILIAFELFCLSSILPNPSSYLTIFAEVLMLILTIILSVFPMLTFLVQYQNLVSRVVMWKDQIARNPFWID